jgi:hypothetical protein
MRATLATLVILLAAAAPASAAPSSVLAHTVSCDAAGRTATFEGDMTARRGASRMQMRFVLQMRDGARWVRAEKLGAWNTSDDRVKRYVFTKIVENLPAPGAYRALVYFRWLDAGGKVLARSSRLTRGCTVADMRANLVPARIEVDGGGDWSLVVRNRGRAAAGPFTVILSVDGVDRPAREVAGLAAGSKVALAFKASDCRQGLRVVVDAGGSVDERDEDDNVLEVPCPA